MDVTDLRVRGWVVVVLSVMVGACGGDDGGTLPIPTGANGPPASSSIPGGNGAETSPPTAPPAGHPAAGNPAARIPPVAIPPGQLNRAPRIAGVPGRAVLHGTPYVFTPTGEDTDGDALQYSIVNAPEWATVDTATGRLSGTPGAEHVGSTSHIVISVSDGELTTSLAEFALTVQAVATGTAMVSWVPPTTNTDGSPATNLAGYKIYWGNSAGEFPHSVTLDNPGLTAYVVTNLVPGTWFFAATALNSLGIESAPSQGSKTIH